MDVSNPKDLLPHEKIDLDPDFRAIHQPPPGEEFPRLPSPPPSYHSSQDDGSDSEDKKEDKSWKKEKQLKTQKEYAKVRNANVNAYFKQLQKKPPLTKKEILDNLSKDKLESMKMLTASDDQDSSDVDDEIVCYSETCEDSDSSFPRNNARAFAKFEKQCYQTDMDHRKQLIGKEERLTFGVYFCHDDFQMILEGKWELLKVTRLIQIFEGVQLDCKVDPRWMMVEDELQKIYGPMDIKSEHFARMLDAFTMQRMEMIIKMFEEETQMLERMIKEKKCPSDFPEKLAALRKVRASLEEKIYAMSLELECDQNPYTNLERMDFWVMPRPPQTIAVYKSRKEEMEDFVECNLPLDRVGLPIEGGGDLSIKPFIRKGYNPAVFDIGWSYSAKKIYGDCPWRHFFLNGIVSKNEEIWRQHLLNLRGELMTYHPFGVEANQFFKHFRTKFNISEDASIFGELMDQVGIMYLSDLFYSLNLGRGDCGKVILFDSLFKGLILPPEFMLYQLWMRVRFLIDERPNQLLPLDRVKGIYENYFGQTFFPLQWGFKDVEEFVRNVNLYLPKEQTEDVIIVTKSKTEVEEMNKIGNKEVEEEKAQKEMDEEWAEIVGNEEGEDEEENGEWSKYFSGSQWNQEFIQEGPWIPDGAVYRVLDD